MNIKISFLLTCLIYVFNDSCAKENTTLKLVQILFRHGDRWPIDLYPNDPNPVSAFVDGLGQLSMLGRKQHYALGKYFRSMYGNFTTYSPSEVNVISSEDDRCLKSAAVNLASFYAPDARLTFENNLKWQPISIHYIPKDKDKYLEMNSYCPRADEEEMRVLNSPQGQRSLSEHWQMFQNLSVYSGADVNNWTTADDLYDVLLIEKKYGLVVPPGIEPFWEELKNVSAMSCFWRFNSPLLHRLRAGPFLQRVIENINRNLQEVLPLVHIFSGHDSTIAAVLNALNLYDMKPPPYCSSLIFELHEMPNGENAIRLLYMNSTHPEVHINSPQVLILEGCTEFCPLDYFINYTNPLMPEYWEEECQLDKSLVEKITQKQVTIGWFFILIAIIIVALSAYVLWKIYYHRQDKKFVSAIKYNSLDAS